MSKQSQELTLERTPVTTAMAPMFEHTKRPTKSNAT